MSKNILIAITTFLLLFSLSVQVDLPTDAGVARLDQFFVLYFEDADGGNSIIVTIQCLVPNSGFSLISQISGNKYDAWEYDASSETFADKYIADISSSFTSVEDDSQSFGFPQIEATESQTIIRFMRPRANDGESNDVVLTGTGTIGEIRYYLSGYGNTAVDYDTIYTNTFAASVSIDPDEDETYTQAGDLSSLSSANLLRIGPNMHAQTVQENYRNEDIQRYILTVYYLPDLGEFDWFAFGHRDDTDTTEYDILVFEIRGAGLVISDRYALIDAEDPAIDSERNIELEGFQIEEDHITVKFYRPIDTGDSEDKEVESANDILSGYGVGTTIDFTDADSWMSETQDVAFDEDGTTLSVGDISPPEFGASTGFMEINSKIHLYFQYSDSKGEPVESGATHLVWYVETTTSLSDSWFVIGVSADGETFDFQLFQYLSSSDLVEVTDSNGEIGDNLASAEDETNENRLLGYQWGDSKATIVKFLRPLTGLEDDLDLEITQTDLYVYWTYQTGDFSGTGDLGSFFDILTASAAELKSWVPNQVSEGDLTTIGMDSSEEDVEFGFFRVGFNVNVRYQYVDGSGNAVADIEDATRIAIMLECFGGCKWFGLIWQIDSASYDVHIAEVDNGAIVLSDRNIFSTQISGEPLVAGDPADLVVLGYSVTPNKAVIKYQRLLDINNGFGDYDELSPSVAVPTASAYSTTTSEIEISDNLSDLVERNWVISPIPDESEDAYGDVSLEGLAKQEIDNQLSIYYSYSCSSTADDGYPIVDEATFAVVTNISTIFDFIVFGFQIEYEEDDEDYNEDTYDMIAIQVIETQVIILDGSGDITVPEFNEDEQQDITILGYQQNSTHFVAKFSRIGTVDPDDSADRSPLMPRETLKTIVYYGFYDSDEMDLSSTENVNTIGEMEVDWAPSNLNSDSCEYSLAEEEEGGEIDEGGEFNIIGSDSSSILLVGLNVFIVMAIWLFMIEL